MAEQMTPAQFAQTIKAKHPGSYDDIPDEELAQKVLAKYPQYRGDVKTHFEMEREPGTQPGVLESAGKTVKGLLMPAGQNPYPGMGLDQKQEAFQAAQDADQRRIDTGRSVSYRAAAAAANPFIDVQGMEDAAEHANPSGVVGHAAGSALPYLAPIAIRGARVPVGEGLKNASYGIYNNVLGTKGSGLAFEGNPGRGVAQEGLVAGSRPRLLNKIDESLKTRGPQIDQVLDLPQHRAISLDINEPVNEPFQSTIRSGTKGALSDATLNRLKQAQQELTMERSAPGEYTGQPKNLKLNPLDANNVKREIQGRANYANPENDELVNSTLKRSAGGVRDAVHEAVPEVAPFDKRVQDLRGAHGALAKRINGRLANPGSTGFKDVAPGAVGLIAGGPPAAVSAMAAREILGATPVKTAGAQLLYRTGNLLSPDAPLTIPKPRQPMPTPIRGLLKSAPIQLGSNMEPIEDVGPMSQPAGSVVQRNPGSGRMQKMFTTAPKSPRGVRVPLEDEDDIERARR